MRTHLWRRIAWSDWSSFLHYTTGKEGIVEIESQWTAQTRELQMSASIERHCSHPSQKTRRMGHTPCSDVERVGHPPHFVIEKIPVEIRGFPGAQMRGTSGARRVRESQPATWTRRGPRSRGSACVTLEWQRLSPTTSVVFPFTIQFCDKRYTFQEPNCIFNPEKRHSHVRSGKGPF